MLNQVILEGRVTNILKGSISIINNKFEMDILIPEEIKELPFKKNSHIFVIGYVDEFGIKAKEIKYFGEYKLKTFDNLFELEEKEETDYDKTIFTDAEYEQIEQEVEEKRKQKKGKNN